MSEQWQAWGSSLRQQGSHFSRQRWRPVCGIRLQGWGWYRIQWALQRLSCVGWSWNRDIAAAPAPAAHGYLVKGRSQLDWGAPSSSALRLWFLGGLGSSSGSAAVWASPQYSQPDTAAVFPWLSCLTLSIYINISAEERFFFLSVWLCTLAKESLTRPLLVFIFLLQLPYHKFHH